MKIELKQLSLDYASEPNIADPSFEIEGNNIKLTFPLNTYIFDFEEGKEGVIEFINVKSYRSGRPNDEGYYRYKDNPVWNVDNIRDIEWDNFFEASNVPQEYLDTFTPLNNTEGNLKHYVFFMKEGTFECLAESYKEIINEEN